MSFFRIRVINRLKQIRGMKHKKILRNEKIDLLILDVRLPQINGLDVLKKVKIDYSTIEVIIVSAHGDMDTVIAAL